MVALVNFLEGGAEAFLSCRVAYRRDDQTLAIGRHGERGVGVDLKKVQHAAVDYEGQTIPMLCYYRSRLASRSRTAFRSVKLASSSGTLSMR